ncbi:unnamed protein product, partial [Oikopleura dioica]
MTCHNPLEPATSETLKGKPGSKIFGGSGAPRETYRWQVPLFDNDSNFICSGALLTKNQGASPDWVLSSAQCCDGRSSIIAKLGDFHLDSYDNGEIVISSDKIFILEDFQKFGEWSGNDACLINIGRVTASQSTIYEPVCISNDMPIDGAMCYVSGWGSLKALSGNLNNLHASPVNYFPDNYCASIGYGNIQTSSEFCAGVPDSIFDETKDICNGDVGSPLVCEIAGKPVLSGMFSWGTSACVGPNRPSVFSKVSAFVPWILDITSQGSTTTTSPPTTTTPSGPPTTTTSGGSTTTSTSGDLNCFGLTSEQYSMEVTNFWESSGNYNFQVRPSVPLTGFTDTYLLKVNFKWPVNDIETWGNTVNNPVPSSASESEDWDLFFDNKWDINPVEFLLQGSVASQHISDASLTTLLPKSLK